ncbi:MAG: TetR/AcrR family transcriptional regulator [Acidimicrobiaceae bacterium]|jgi:AcrR family transcriptional regulator|nr:TetR/AcrR family transcriptional regulator [Acidimicrobiaceae bacterium]
MTANPLTSEGTATRPSNRRALILDAAIGLFREGGYPATSVDDIGKAVDVSGPAIYRHFSSKEEILLEAIRLAADEVHAANGEARNSTADPRTLLAAYIGAYVVCALDRSTLIAVWTTEARHLSSERRSPVTRRLRSWSNEWVEALTAIRPELSTEQARVLVGGAIGLITSLATNDDGSLGRAQLSGMITAMALATLDTPF